LGSLDTAAEGGGIGISPDSWDRLALLLDVGGVMLFHALSLLLFLLTSVVHLLSGEIDLTPRIRDRPRLFEIGRTLLNGRFTGGA
jgi:hypothetical protein